MTLVENPIETATTWLVDNWHVAPQPLTKTLREIFGLKFNDAVKAMVKARAAVERKKSGQ
jgi:hypothetical protein